MNKENEKLFVKCWRNEYQATAKCNELSEKIDYLTQNGMPSLRFENSLDNWRNKQNEACKPLIPLIQNGTFGENAPELCSEKLGYIGGYVNDCYHELWLDHKPEKTEETKITSNTFSDKLHLFPVLDSLPEIKAKIESASSDILANLMTLATYTYIDLYMESPDFNTMSAEEIKDVTNEIIRSFDHRELNEQAIKNIEFVNKNLQSTPPKGCDFQVGDIVTYTNSYGVSFENKMVIGFDHSNSDRPVHTAGESYWFGSEIHSLSKKNNSTKQNSLSALKEECKKTITEYSDSITQESLFTVTGCDWDRENQVHAVLGCVDDACNENECLDIINELELASEFLLQRNQNTEHQGEISPSRSFVP